MSVWRSGRTVPADSLGEDGDLYFKTNTNDVYERASGAYSIIAGSSGAAVLTDSGPPLTGTGADGDFYLDLSATNIYGPKATTWGSPTHLAFPQALQLRRDSTANWAAANSILAQGEVGVEIDTLKFKIGTGSTPWNALDYADVLGPGAIAIDYRFNDTTTNADPGDGYLRLDNSTQLSATTIRADLLDIHGADVTAILDALDDSSNAIKGHIRICKTRDPTKWILFELTAVASVTGYRNIAVTVLGGSGANPFVNFDRVTLIFSRAGDIGTSGAPGAPGAVWRAGSGIPSNSLGINGDFYLDSATGGVYEKSGGSYSVVANILGPTGDPGADGRTIFSGHGAPSSGLGADGDFYVDVDVTAIYGPKASGSWGSPTYLIGAPGDGVSTYLWQSEEPPNTGTHKRFYTDRDGIIRWCRGEVLNGDGSSTVQFDVQKNGASIYPTATKPSVSAGQYIGAERVPDTTSFVKGDYFQIVVNSVGGTQGGLRLGINFRYSGV